MLSTGSPWQSQPHVRLTYLPCIVKYLGKLDLAAVYFYLRIDNEIGSDFFKMDKELHLNKLHSPFANEMEEKYCRRWIAVTLLKDLEKKLSKLENSTTPDFEVITELLAKIESVRSHVRD